MRNPPRSCAIERLRRRPRLGSHLPWKISPARSAHSRAALQRRIGGLVIFLFEACDQVGRRDDSAYAADALARTPDILPRLRLGALARGIGSKTHFRGIRLR